LVGGGFFFFFVGGGGFFFFSFFFCGVVGGFCPGCVFFCFWVLFCGFFFFFFFFFFFVLFFFVLSLRGCRGEKFPQWPTFHAQSHFFSTTGSPDLLSKFGNEDAPPPLRRIVLPRIFPSPLFACGRADGGRLFWTTSLPPI